MLRPDACKRLRPFFFWRCYPRYGDRRPIRGVPQGEAYEYSNPRSHGTGRHLYRLEDQHAFFYYTRLTVALSPDPLFQVVTRIVELEPPLGDEKVIEKFESYVVGDHLHIISENNLASGHWGTGILIYKMQDGSHQQIPR